MHFCARSGTRDSHVEDVFVCNYRYCLKLRGSHNFLRRVTECVFVPLMLRAESADVVSRAMSLVVDNKHSETFQNRRKPHVRDIVELRC